MQRITRPILAALALSMCALSAFVAGMLAPFAWALRLSPHPVQRAFVLCVYHVLCVKAQMRHMLGRALHALPFRLGLALQAFPGTVTADLAFGVPGEVAFDGPFRSQPARINDATANVVVGRWFTLAADGTAQAGGTGSIGGILMNPKTYASVGTGGIPLAATLTVPNGTVAEFGYMGAFIVAAPAAVAIGNAAKYTTATGVIGVGAPSAGEAAVPNSKFIRVANAAAGLAVLELTN